MSELDRNDLKDQPERLNHIQQKIAKLKANKIKYEVLSDSLSQSQEPQISTTDADARALLIQGQVVEVSYNMQAAVDQRHNLVVATHTINRNDRNALSDIALETQASLGFCGPGVECILWHRVPVIAQFFEEVVMGTNPLLFHVVPQFSSVITQ